MATLMQKDVLLEGVFQALGYVINKNPNLKLQYEIEHSVNP